jgi:hypothetical protein
MELNVSFRNWQQKSVYYCTKRNQCFSGGYNNGKTWVICLKALSLLMMFNNYRVIMARQVYADLKRTTMQTFFAMCPTEFIASHNEQEGLTQLVNGSLIYWMHLDRVDENSLRGIEPNSIFVDQGEEVLEQVFLALDSRVGRWSHALVPQALLHQFPDWPLKDGRPIVPSYFVIGCNPDTEFHFIYRKYHPLSSERDPDYFFVEGEWDSSLGSEETYAEALKRDPEWVAKYVKGQWGTSSAAIHQIRPESILDPKDTVTLANGKVVNVVQWVLEKASLSRVLDHGSTAPTCCGWAGSVGGVYIFYREYYVANQKISYHRTEINKLSGVEVYTGGEYADPHIFDKASQAKGGLYSVADEYLDKDLDGPSIAWQKADNNEFATRNRINELLAPSNRFHHPITKLSPAPGVYFIKKTVEYPYGCSEIIRQTGAQRKQLLGVVDGKSIYGDDRDDNVVDHAYDVLRYFVSMHSSQPRQEQRRPARLSFNYYKAVSSYFKTGERVAVPNHN